MTSHHDTIVENTRPAEHSEDGPAEPPVDLTRPDISDEDSTEQHDAAPDLGFDRVEVDSTVLDIDGEASTEHVAHEYDPNADPFSLPSYYPWNNPENVHRIVKSASSVDQKYQLIDYGTGDRLYNPNVLPHPSLPDTYIVITQHANQMSIGMQLGKLACNAKFVDGNLTCVQEPYMLPILNVEGDKSKCPPGNELIFMYRGPHDARISWGPQFPYIIFGSNSAYSCLGIWIQDLCVLIDPKIETDPRDLFINATEMQKPTKYHNVEKNYFVFWDTDEQIYVRHNIFPKRTFSKLWRDGSVGSDLGPAANDEACITSHLGGRPLSNRESIHQATNSLAVTLCSRSDPDCVANDDNTVIFTIYQHKSVYQVHSNYEPFVMAFRQTAPFSIYGFSQKAIYIHGRTKPGDTRPEWLDEKYYDQTEMFYVISMSWKAQGQRYHGYLDDVLLINFGIEDKQAATINVHVSDLFLDMKRCSDPL